ncbi:MAG: trypsin-like peptidase domain-containing protein [Ardenticatenaceae bacterium]|nr:trypsin-like peptidase domain-containing protein [Ardenticatenaceae bacterium]
MNETETAAFLSAIHQLLLAHFSEEELKNLCLGLGVAYDDLPAAGRENKARELVTYLERRGRLDELRLAVLKARPSAIWPKPAAAPQPQPTLPVRWQLDVADRARLLDLLVARPEFRTDDRRDAFIEEMLAGSPRKGHIQGQINLGGPPRQFAGHLLTVLTQFGQDEPGQEVLGLLLNHLLPYLGGSADADFIHSLFDRYPLKTNPIATRSLTGAAWRGHESPATVQEKIIGENTLRDVRLLELALDAARAVVRIVTADSLGSGFLVGPGLIMTNHHVIGSQPAAQPCAFQFHYQLDKQLTPRPILAARAKPGGLFYTNPDLDVTVVEVLDVPADVAPLTLARRRVAPESRVNIIQHPGGHYKKISMQNNFVAFADARHLQYLTSTEPGSSGSPVFDNDFLVIGIHHSGGMLLEPGSEQKYLRNAGSSMIAVLDDLRDHAPEIYQHLCLL